MFESISMVGGCRRFLSIKKSYLSPDTFKDKINELLLVNFLDLKKSTSFPPDMRRRSDVSFKSHIGRDVADHVKTSSRRLNWYVNVTDLFEMPLGLLTGT